MNFISWHQWHSAYLLLGYDFYQVLVFITWQTMSFVKSVLLSTLYNSLNLGQVCGCFLLMCSMHRTLFLWIRGIAYMHACLKLIYTYIYKVQTTCIAKMRACLTLIYTYIYKVQTTCVPSTKCFNNLLFHFSVAISWV